MSTGSFLLSERKCEREKKVMNANTNTKKWRCLVCGFIYDEAKGWEDIAPGTAWEDVPEDWLCPDCGVGKQEFQMVPVE